MQIAGLSLLEMEPLVTTMSTKEKYIKIVPNISNLRTRYTSKCKIL
jgi:hypothetical protein